MDDQNSNGGDNIIPFHYFDDLWHNHAILLNFTYRFDDVLDPQVLKSSLWRLLEKEGWRKLGGRIRKNAQDAGRLEYHVPSKYDDGTPPFLYHQEDFQQSIDEHPLASQLPRAKDTLSIYPNSDAFYAFAHPDRPLKMEDWTTSDAPPLSLSIWSFHDATLLTLSYSHSLADIVGQECLLKGWTALINGREDEVPPFVGFKEDPLDSVAGLATAENHALYDKLVTDFGNFSMPPAQAKSARDVQLPGAFVERLRGEAKQGLRRELKTDEAPFLSDGDILYAWWAKLTVTALNLPPEQKLSLNNIYNFSGLIDEALPPSGAYVGNLAAEIYTFTTVEEVCEQPLGIIALRLRNDVLQQRSPEQVKALVTLHKECMKKRGIPPLFGSLDQITFHWSNWHRGRFYDFDFSGAVVKSGTPSNRRKNGIGRPSLICLTGHENGIQVINGGALMGRDAGGNYWIHWSMLDDAWPLVEKAIKDIATGT